MLVIFTLAINFLSMVKMYFVSVYFVGKKRVAFYDEKRKTILGKLVHSVSINPVLSTIKLLRWFIICQEAAIMTYYPNCTGQCEGIYAGAVLVGFTGFQKLIRFTELA